MDVEALCVRSLVLLLEHVQLSLLLLQLGLHSADLIKIALVEHDVPDLLDLSQPLIMRFVLIYGQNAQLGWLDLRPGAQRQRLFSGREHPYSGDGSDSGASRAHLVVLEDLLDGIRSTVWALNEGHVMVHVEAFFELHLLQHHHLLFLLMLLSGGEEAKFSFAHRTTFR